MVLRDEEEEKRPLKKKKKKKDERKMTLHFRKEAKRGKVGVA